MAENSLISWTDHTLNVWAGCTKVSPACDGCYAENLMDLRFGRAQWGAPGAGKGTRIEIKNWRKNLRKFERDAFVRYRFDGHQTFVFVNSLSDFFDNHPDCGPWRKDFFDAVRSLPPRTTERPHIVFLLLTKRPSNIEKMSALAGGLPPVCAIGTTVEDQTRADMNVPAILSASEGLWHAKTKPAFVFLSMEPLIGPVDLTAFRDEGSSNAAYFTDALRGKIWMPAGSNPYPGTGHVVGERDYVSLCHSVQWVITGGETDQGSHRARPSHPEWFRDLRDNCLAASVAFHHKQNGEWVSVSEVEGPGEHFSFPGGATVRRVGKKRSGRTIDGVEHDARPVV